MDIVPCTCTYECEFIQLPDVQTLTDEEFDKVRRFAWRAFGVSCVNLLTNFNAEKYSIELTGDEGCSVAEVGEYLVYNKNLRRVDILTPEQFQQCCTIKEDRDAQGKI
ncbi:MAG: hypothetical protein DBY43_04575 [Clostridiaceae bacterium]|nr:MAG: hypothetical protein DBY43_03885 [Clostridiaceae bacterium]PWL42064.1 MAG: hypothetical protein DBY43_04230 [Clostridiaceae bacterium]PWL42132.1 MAG: hypothetical protein DBY43_04575 [Clostridiaceae bacterium]